MKEKLALLLGMVLCATMTFSAGGLAWAQPPNQPEPPKKHRKVCLRWTKIVKWPDPEHEQDNSAASATDPPDPGYHKVQKENKYLWKKVKAAYAYQAHSPRVFAYGDDPSIKGTWKFKVLKKLTKQECLGKNPEDPYKKYKKLSSWLFRWWRR